MPELVTQSIEEYEALALQLAANPRRLQDVRAKLAKNTAAAGLFDTDRFRHHIDAAYEEMWRIWERGEPPRPFAV